MSSLCYAGLCRHLSSGPGAPDGQPLGEIDSNWTQTKSIGTTLQLTDTDKILDHKNTIAAGVSVDHGWTHFGGLSMLGTLPPDLVVQSSGEHHRRAGLTTFLRSICNAQNTYIGVYVLDDFDVTDQLSVHAGARFNDALTQLGGLDRRKPQSERKR